MQLKTICDNGLDVHYIKPIFVHKTKNKCHHNMMPSYYDAEYLIFCHFLVMTHLVKLWNAFSLAFIRSPNYVPIVLIYELLHQRQYKQLFKWREDL